MEKIDPHGFWIGDSGFVHSFDSSLAEEIGNFLIEKGAKSFADFGCGNGNYVKYFRDRGLTFSKGFDGNPDTQKITGGVAEVLDLAKPQDLGRRFSWVMSLEVGEHIPKRYQEIFIDNIVRHAESGIILSWAVPGQGGQGHFNERSNESVRHSFKKRGFISECSLEERFRTSSDIWYFRETILVFEREL